MNPFNNHPKCKVCDHWCPETNMSGDEQSTRRYCNEMETHTNPDEYCSNNTELDKEK